jgi:hypothetical protein
MAAKRCRLGIAGAARGSRDRLVALAEHRDGQLQRPRQLRLLQVRPSRVVKDPRHRRPLRQHPGHRPSTPRREPQHHTRGLLTIQDQRAAVEQRPVTSVNDPPVTAVPAVRIEKVS